MSMGITPVAFEAVGDWHLWLPLTGVLVLCWGLVVVAAAALFGGPAGGRNSRRFTTLARDVRGDRPTHEESQQAGVRND